MHPLRPTLALLLLALPSALAGAQDAAPPRPLSVTSAVEYVYPRTDDRRIGTITTDVGVRTLVWRPHAVSLGVGLTTTYAHGHLVQLDQSLNRVRYETEAFGIGPAVHAQALPFRLGALAVGVDGSAGLLYYSRRFPSGGDRYNGMLRIGPAASLPLAAGTRLDLTARWMHVSNGQGLGPHNPSYEGWALAAGVARDVAWHGSGERGPRRRTVVAGVLGGVMGLATGLLLSQDCDDSCAFGAGIAAVGAGVGTGVGIALGALWPR